MQRFHFPLGRVRSLRELQRQMEEAKLQNLHSSLQVLDGRIQALQDEVEEAQRAVAQGVLALSCELGSLDRFRQSAYSQAASLEKERAECLRKVAEQQTIVREAERRVKLLDKLRERRLACWTRESQQEVESLATESYLARLVRMR